MPDLTVRNIPKDLYRSLQRSAKRNRRSLNDEILALLSDEDARVRRRWELAEVIPELARAREEIARKYPDLPDSIEMIREDRETR